LHADEDGRFDRIPPFIQRDAARDAGKVARTGDRIADIRRAQGLGPAHRRSQDLGSVVRRGGDSIRDGSVGRLEMSHELLDGRVLVLGRKVRREERAIQGLSADLKKSRGVPAIPAQQRRPNAELLGLPRDQTHFGVVSRNEDRVRVAAFDRGQLGFEIHVATCVTLIHRDVPAPSSERVDESAGQSGAVVAFDIAQDGDLSEFQGFERVLGHYATLEHVDKTGAKDEVTLFRNLRVDG
jgi:hypothetical protein